MTLSKTKMKLMADYQCWCIWNVEEAENINPDTLPISTDLKNSLHSWEAKFDSTLDLESQDNIGFKSDAEYCRFYDRGWQLFDRLRVELPDVEWWYRDRRYHTPLREKPQ